MQISFNIGMGHAPIKGVGYSTEAVALFARFTTPADAARKTLLDAFIKADKAGGAWSTSDLLHVLAAHDAQAGRQNFKGNYGNLAAVASPTFTVDRGYKGDASAANLDASYNPSTAGRLHSLDSASVGVWLNIQPTAGGGYIELYTGSSRLFRRASPTTNYGHRINDGSTFYTSPAQFTGHFTVVRRPGPVREFYFNGVSVTSDATAAVSVGTVFQLLAAGAVGFSDARIAASYLGGEMSSAQVLARHNALNTLLTTIGGA